MKPTSNTEKQCPPTYVLFFPILKVFYPIPIMKFGHLVISKSKSKILGINSFLDIIWKLSNYVFLNDFEKKEHV